MTLSFISGRCYVKPWEDIYENVRSYGRTWIDFDPPIPSLRTVHFTADPMASWKLPFKYRQMMLNKTWEGNLPSYWVPSGYYSVTICVNNDWYRYINPLMWFSITHLLSSWLSSPERAENISETVYFWKSWQLKQNNDFNVAIIQVVFIISSSCLLLLSVTINRN